MLWLAFDKKVREDGTELVRIRDPRFFPHHQPSTAMNRLAIWAANAVDTFRLVIELTTFDVQYMIFSMTFFVKHTLEHGPTHSGAI